MITVGLLAVQADDAAASPREYCCLPK